MEPVKHTGNVVDLGKRRRALGSQVYNCGKCKEQAVVLLGDHSIRCGRVEPEICGVQFAADWYAPTGKKLVATTTAPRYRTKDGIVQYFCGICNYKFFHMQADGSLTCYREQCKHVVLFRWKWHKDLSKAKGRRKK